MLNTLRSITVVNWPEELFLDHYNPAADVEGTIAIRVDKILKEAWNCVAIERTTETETRGKYLLIFQEIDMERAKVTIGELIEAFGRTSDRDSAKIALARFQEYPEFDSIQRVSQSVQSKGLRIREMLEAAAAQRTVSTPKKQQQTKFQFHVNNELQKQLQISTPKTYSTVTEQTPQKKQLMIVQQSHHKLQPIIRHQIATQTKQINEEGKANQQQDLNEQGMGVSREEWEEAKARTRKVQNAVTQESRTIATNNSGLLIDQQTITTMMTQITHQFKEMERERITREERQERKRQEREIKAEEKREEREARVEEKQAEAQREMYKFMQAMMMMNQNNNKEKLQENEATNIPDELTTGTTEQTSALTTSIVTASTMNTPTGKRASSLLSNTDEETEMTDKETETEAEEYVSADDTISIKRNKKLTDEAEEEDDKTVEVEEMIIEKEQEATKTNENGGNKTADETMTDTGSFTTGFYNQQFRSTNKASTEATQQ